MNAVHDLAGAGDLKVLAVVPGPPDHGVVRHGLVVADLVGAHVVRTLAPVPGAWDVTHVQFTDALFGTEIGSAAAAFESWAATAPRPLVVTLHDVPGADTDTGRAARRAAGYGRVAAAADAVVVCSDHEADRLQPRPYVVPLPVDALTAPGPRPAWADRPSIAVLGFLYPGKGHERVVAAAAGTGALVVAIGGPSPGHEGLVEDLQRQARDAGVELLVTGPLSDADLHAAARAVTVPVASYATTGASGSLVTWIAAGRRPVTTSGPYADELDARWPGSLLPTGDLAAGLRAALADPGSTHAPPPPRPDVGELLRAVYRALPA